MSNQIQGFRLSPQQARLWSSRPDGRVESVQCVLSLEGPLETGRLRGALQRVVDRHEILRTTFHRRPGIRFPIQVIAEAGQPCWRTLDLTGRACAEQEAEVASVIREEGERPFDPERGPSLLRATLIALAPAKHLLLLTLPALCADARTLKNLFQEVAAFYGAAADSELSDAELPEEPTQYVQFSEWQNQLLEAEESEAGKAFWRESSLRAGAPPTLPFVRRSAGGPQFRPAALALSLLPAVAERLERVAAKFDATAADVLLCCWHLLLCRLGGQAGVQLGVNADGREFEEIHGALGTFNRWLPVGCAVEGDERFREALRRVGDAVRATCEWQDYYAADGDGAHANGDGAPLPVRFDYESWPDARRAGGVTFSFAEQLDHADRYALKLSGLRRADALQLRLDYDAGALGEAEAALLVERFLTLMADALGRPECEVGRLEVVGEGERLQLARWSRATPGHAPTCVHRLFEQQAERTPASVAVIHGGEQLSYRELNEQANRLASHLRALGVGPDSLVGVLMERSVEMVVSLLATLKAGGAYVPLDASYPAERVRFMLEDSGARVLLTQGRLRGAAADAGAGGGVRVACVDEEWAEIASAHAAGNLEGGAGPENLAYVIYTSGSTGRPKGVMIPHRGLANYLNWCTKAYAVVEGRGTLVHTPLGFDLTVTSLFPPLLVGRYVKLLPEEHGIDELSAALSAGDDLSLVKITPAQLDMLGQWLADREVSIRARAFVIGGEALHWSGLSFWRKNAPHARLINEYGPTETTVGCSVYEAGAARAAGSGVVPIGRPVAATQLYVLDPHGRPAPIGTTGELFLGGDGLARGYLGRPALTAERFTPHPFGDTPGARLYRTGDLARQLPDGELEFLGRVDGQVKLRGFRVELGEVECVLKEHPAVREAVAAVREDAPGEPRLVAYWVPQTQTDGAAGGDLRPFLRERLPHYMIPSALVELDRLPLTPNGKVDRRALPAPDALRAKPESEYVKPRTEVESTIVRIWQDMLRVERVGVGDNFFDLGGHSMLMVQLHSRLRASLNRDIPIIALFGHPTISSLAEFLSRQDSEESILPQSHDRADHRRASITRQKRVRQQHQKQLGLRDG